MAILSKSDVETDEIMVKFNEILIKVVTCEDFVAPLV